MSIVGSYDDLDMQGIDPVFYASVPRSDQDAFRNFPDVTLRFLWRSSEQTHVLAVQRPGWACNIDGYTLKDWCVMIWDWPPRFTAEQLATNLHNMVRATDYAGEGEDQEERMQKDVDRKIDDHREQHLQKTNEDLSDFFDSEYPRGVLQETAICRDGERLDEKRGDMEHGARKAVERGRILLPDGQGDWVERKVSA